MKERKFSRVYTGKEYDLSISTLENFESSIECIQPNSTEATMLVLWLNIHENGETNQITHDLYNVFLLAGINIISSPIRHIKTMSHDTALFKQAIQSARMIMLERKLVADDLI